MKPLAILYGRKPIGIGNAPGTLASWVLLQFFLLIPYMESTLKTKAYSKVIKTTINPTNTPQSQPIPGKQMVQNNAGGWNFAVTKWTQLDRFLIMGSEGGNYYVGEKKLTEQNAANVIACIKEDGIRAIDTIVAISDAGRAAKNDPAIFALALAAASDNPATRKYALQALPKVARTGTHLFHFVSYINDLRGWSRSLRKAISDWYLTRSDRALETQLAKYQARDGWSHRDVLRLAHPRPKNETQSLALRWAVGVYHSQNDKTSKMYNPEKFASDAQMMRKALPMIDAYEQIKTETSNTKIVQLITDHKLPLELVPTEKRTKEVYDAIIPNLGITALIRQLPTLTRANVLGELGNANTKYIVSQLQDADVIKKGRIHPITVLNALVTYKGGRSFKGTSTWDPINKLVDALDDAFYLSFGAVVPTGKRIMLALDVSGSMTSGGVIGSELLTPAQVSAVMAMVTARTESDWMVMGYDNRLRKLDVTPKMRLDAVVKATSNINGGGTDCSIPMNWALEKNIPVDAFVSYTDNETWAGTRNHPVQALKAYQQKMGIPAKLISVATSSTDHSIVEDTAFTMNVTGFDSAAPNVISDFIRN